MLEYTKPQVHNGSFYNMRCFVIFITTVCLLFLLKLKCAKNKSVYKIDASFLCVFSN